ncbi:IucA/IucC family protein [Neobacillus kokaensis]|uniref:Siderophore biosynthesis protein, IucA/IucC family n=1 Tax=Neobacillus kokaensis TaxID=2759023 RepID=A0ABQ3NAL2_9BACI|nr:IucA/IucC family protein [Neobacillus kokaensis]GHH99641.1 siderophore biosynthesis protein, IucA/IucC family [Neobacillus kokaensis]
MSITSAQLLKKETSFKEGDMLKDELKVLNFLRSKHPEMASVYVQSLTKGRQGILRRLASSMLREDIKGLDSNSYDLVVIESIYALNVPAIDEFWQRIMAVLHTYPLKSGKVYKLYPLSSEGCLVIPVGRRYAYNRSEVEGDILHIFNMEIKTIKHAAELLELLGCKAEVNSEHSSWQRFTEELINGSANLALSYAYWNQKKKELQQQAAEQGVTNTIDYVLLQKKQNRRFDTSLFFEQLSIEGHNLHPGTKTKMGMEPEDVFRYAPEFEGAAGLHFAAIRKDFAEWRGSEEHEQDANAFLFKEYPHLPRTAEQELAELGLNMADYVFVPVHPWQLKHAIPVIYQQEIEQHIVIPLHGIVVPCGATSSFRTVVPLGNGETSKHSIKVAVNSQMTSTVRSISAQTTNNAAVFTQLICSVMQREQNLLKTFIPVCEYGGFNYKASNRDHHHELKDRNLSAVIRENVESFITDDEVAIVGSSLFAESPISEKSVLFELIEQYARQKNEPALRQAAFQFVSEYLSIALPGFLTLMTKYGIGLEGHLQNSVIVFKHGCPVRVLFRDWGGTRIYRPRLQQHQIDVQFYPGSVTLTDCISEMHNKVFYTVFQNHCGELILQVCKQFGLREKELWQQVHLICKEVFDQLEKQPSYRESINIDRTALYQEKVSHKALTKMRLEPKGKNYSYAIVLNPLHDFGEKEG